MPHAYNKLSILRCKGLGFRQLPNLKSLGFPQLHRLFNTEDRFAAPVPYVNMDGSVVVAVKEKPIPIFLKNPRHASRIYSHAELAINFVETLWLTGHSRPWVKGLKEAVWLPFILSRVARVGRAARTSSHRAGYAF